MFQVDAMLQKLEKEIDDVDAKIGDRWRLLDKYVSEHVSNCSFYIKGGKICCSIKYKWKDGRTIMEWCELYLERERE